MHKSDPEVTSNTPRPIKMISMLNKLFFSQKSQIKTHHLLMISLLHACLIVIAYVSYAHSDIYRFVTVDGIETFTDAPLNKEARIILKDKAINPRKHRKTRKNNTPQQTHDISLDDIVEKTVMTAINSQDPATSSANEPRLPPVGGVISSGVGMRIDPIDGRWRHHNGIDIAISEGTPVRPAASGTVVFSGQRPGYGYTVLVEHDNGMITLYGHNSRLTVTQGQPVDADTVIAFSGNTGRSTGPHLHFEAWQAGINVTPAFMSGNSMQVPKINIADNKRKNHFHKDILADGSILFTNVPDSIP